MEDELEQAVLRAIGLMRNNLGEQLTVDDMAQAAIFSKFHFSRVFQRVTGLSPGRFLSAMRLQEAKRLLTSTSLGVTEISVQVGYSSVGTFSSRFKSSVGVSPTHYRQLGGVVPPEEAAAGDRGDVFGVPARKADAQQSSAPSLSATVRGDIWSPFKDRPVFAGLFPDRILQGSPIRCTVLQRPGPYVLQGVPLGAWHLMAQSVDGDGSVVGCYGPIVIRPDTGTRVADVWLRPQRVLDPPVLLAMADQHA